MLETIHPGSRKAKVWLLISAGMLCIQVVVFVLSQAAFYRVFLNNYGVVSDNQLWVVTHLDIDYEVLKGSLLRAELETVSRDGDTLSDETWSEVTRTFNIYYSRVDTIKNQLALMKAKGEVPARFTRHFARIESNRDDLARMIDSVETPDRGVIQRLRGVFAKVEEPVRALALDNLSVLSRQADSERASAQNYFFLQISAAISTFFLLVAVSVAMFLMLRDTRQANRRMERVLSAQDRLFQQIPFAMVLTDGDGKILRLNHEFEELFGWSAREGLGRDLLETLPKRRRDAWLDGKLDPTQPKLGNGSSTKVRDIVIDKMGRHFPAEISIMHLQMGDGSFYLYIVRSITVEQRAMRALRRDRVEARKWALESSQFLSVMSHEMRTPLHGVVSALELLQREELAPHTEELVDVASLAAQTALKYADQAMDLVALELNPDAVKKSDFSPAEVVLEVSEMLNSMAVLQGNTLTTEIADGLGESVFGYADLVRHSLSNLVGNAIKFTKNGDVVVRVSPGEKDRELRIEVEDTGIGISEQQKEAIASDKVITAEESDTNWKGTGLGLGLFKRAVAGMGGNWGVSSEMGRGSRFWFTFPVSESSDRSRQCPVAAHSRVAALPDGIRVLAVDDNSINLNLLGKMLAALGVDHDLAQNGRDAIEKATQTRFDAIVIDINMPELDGYETTQIIRRSGASRNAKIVAFTADISVETSVQVFKSAGLDDILIKPVTVDTLYNKISQLFGRKLPGDAQHIDDRDVFEVDIIDREALEQIANLDSEGALMPFIDRLLDQAFDLKRSVELGVDNADERLSSQFHDLSGAAGMLGAKKLAAVARVCEASISQNPISRPDVFHLFCETVDATRDEFLTLRERFIGADSR